MFDRISWILWNLFLAMIPVALGYGIAELGRQIACRDRRWLWAVLLPLLVLWLIFLPNSCYLFTELRHLFTAIEQNQLWTRARYDPDAAFGLALRLGVALLYSTAGALTFALSIRPVKAWTRAIGMRTDWAAGPFFILVSVGVYLGLVVRYNSWDMLTRPRLVLETTAGLAHRPLMVAVVILFGIFLWLAYEVNDIWIDGFVLRWARWTRGQAGEVEPEPLTSVGSK